MPGNVNPPLLYTNYEYLSRLVHQPGMIYQLRVNTTAHDPIIAGCHCRKDPESVRRQQDPGHVNADFIRMEHQPDQFHEHVNLLHDVDGSVDRSCWRGRFDGNHEHQCARTNP